MARLATTCSAAVPDDGFDDRDALQASIIAGCPPLAPGVYDVVTPTAVSPARRDYAMIAVAHDALAGSGPATVLRFSGDAGSVQDWYGVALGSGSVLRDLTLDTSALTGTLEQTHAVRITGPADGVEIARVTFLHPQRGMPGGDCVQVVGYSPDRLVSRVSISDSTFAHCDRSGVAIHSGVRGLVVTGCSFPDTGDQDIDGEGTGDIDDVTIDSCTFGVGPAAQGDLAIQIDSSSHVRLSHSTLSGRGVQLYGCTDCEVSSSTIVRTVPGSPMPALDVTKDSARVTVTGTSITRAASAVSGQVVRIAPHNGQPSAFELDSSTLVQRTAASVLSSVGVNGLVIVGSTLRYEGAPGAGNGIDVLGSPTVRGDHATVTGCSFEGPMAAAVRISGSYAGLGSCMTSGNTGSGQAAGLRCEHASGISGPVTSSGNAWGPDVCSLLVP